MTPCECTQLHPPHRVVLTGGPGAGKTAVLELVRQHFCQHVRVLPESASILFGGGFPRGTAPGERRAGQRAIFHVQRELERVAEEGPPPAVVLCDRGTVDGGAYWPGPGTLWDEVGVRLEDERLRYDAVIHLRTPTDARAYNHSNPVRTESVTEAARIDGLIAELWRPHPRLYTVSSTADFLTKAHRALALLRQELPECCRGQRVPGDAGPAP